MQVETSVFLHRLRVADVPYASYRGSQATARQGASADDEAGGVDALAARARALDAQWTPSTDVALVERIVHGDTLVQVAERRLAERLGAATAPAGAAHVLMEAVVAGAPQVMPRRSPRPSGSRRPTRTSRSLARATRALSGLVSYGTVAPASTASATT